MEMSTPTDTKSLLGREGSSDRDASVQQAMAQLEARLSRQMQELQAQTARLDACHCSCSDECSVATLPEVEKRTVVDVRSFRLLEERVEELHVRLDAANERLSERFQQLTPLQSEDQDQLVDLLVTEMEKQQVATSATSIGLQQARGQLRELEARVLEATRQQDKHSKKQTALVRRLEAEYARGSALRDEERHLALQQQDARVADVQLKLERRLKGWQQENQQRQTRLEDAVTHKLVDLVLENEALRAQTLELRTELQRTQSAAQSNRKTLRVLVDELLKLKRQVGDVTPCAVSERLDLGISQALRAAGGSPRRQRR